mmetsp:Transcript_62369/g.185792  ORF Transcript_62369/g.185792 Transcript_62369/m.185792 type:complete len:252 (-) Transcript_62369:1039-1794(-)
MVAQLVVLLVLGGEALQDPHRLLPCGLRDGHGLEAALEGGVALDVLTVLVERGRADALQLPARKGRLQEVRRVDAAAVRATSAAGADERVDLVNDQNHRPVTLTDLLDDVPEAFFKVATVARASQEQGEVELHHPFVHEARRYLALGDALREPMRDGGLADTGLPDKHRIVLRAAAENAHSALQLLRAAHERVQPALLGKLREVLPKLQGLREIHLHKLLLVAGGTLGASGARLRCACRRAGDAVLLLQRL